MRLLTPVLLAVTASARVIGRAGLSDNDSLQISRLLFNDTETGNTTLRFDVYNPDPLSKANTTCSGTWPHDTAYPVDYTLCQDGNFTWRLDEYSGVQSFTLGLTHTYEDPAIGDPPYDTLRVFAMAVMNETVLVLASGNGTTTAMQSNGTSTNAPIYAIVA
ncbi:uncharacterized protein RCC_09274 [Ramularia collo-cygni]|uniref:AA1-like domain-containing protein n=1 Tax=Ramularia collo-cygni TaxID=112498 RepID=A0A2D3V9H0_9PEZI|nr:uncharacterized protein RCC_09274 [Ramularia collo-cygni]CZT23560.1 uncharacterized protein RCC_09274 [Ramularia collo-cygni]